VQTVGLAQNQSEETGGEEASRLQAPAGMLPATRNVSIDGYDAAVLPNGRIITPAGVEAKVGAPKPYGLALSPDGKTLATVNSGAGPFSITLITDLGSNAPASVLIPVNATFMGVVWAPNSRHFYASGGENGNIWIGDAKLGQIVGSVSLNSSLYPLPSPLNPAQDPGGNFLRGTYPGRMTLSPNGRYLYVVDQGGFQVFAIDTTKIVTGTTTNGCTGPYCIVEPNNFGAVVGTAKVGRYPFGIAISADGKRLFVGNVGIFQYTSLAPENPTRDPNKDFPLAYPGTGYPDEVVSDKTINIHKVDPRNLPDTLRIPDGIRTGYIEQNLITYTIPALGDPNAPESSSVSVLDLTNPATPTVVKTVKTGPLIGQVENGIKTFGGSHPNAIAVGPKAIYVANGNNDSISILDKKTYAEIGRVSLTVLEDFKKIKGVQPVNLALSPDARYLYVAEAGINAVGVLRIESSQEAEVIGHIPVGFWPASIAVSADGSTLYVANARGRGAGPNNNFLPDTLGSPKYSDLGSVSIVPVPDGAKLVAYTQRVLKNNGFVASGSENAARDEDHGLPPIRHVIFVNKENSTFDQMLGDLSVSRKGVPIDGDATYSLGQAASPNHHELALEFTVGDNFFLEPNVSSDGHQWLSDTYPTEFEDTHWPAAYGGERNDSGDDPRIFKPYPGRLGFTDANSSPDPEGYDQHGSIFAHLARNQRSFVNFGNGYEFAIVDESQFTDPTGIRQHVNVPMEKVIRDNSDHLYPEFNTSIPDAPLAEDPTRFSRFGRFKQVFESHFVDRKGGVCKLPDYVDLYYPNDHGGGPFDINPNGPAWSYSRFTQDNDDALGRTVELISHSPCWKETVLFVVEDDPQNGFDHVDGSRSIFLAIGPWVKREHVAKTHYSLSSIFKTVYELLGIPPLNQYDAAATDLREIFADKPNVAAYDAQQIHFAKGANQTWIELAKKVDFSRPDRGGEKLREAIAKSEGLPHHPVPEPQANEKKDVGRGAGK
jgi:DNA-binding beta-propeller fold protein YncE